MNKRMFPKLWEEPREQAGMWGCAQVSVLVGGVCAGAAVEPVTRPGKPVPFPGAPGAISLLQAGSLINLIRTLTPWFKKVQMQVSVWALSFITTLLPTQNLSSASPSCPVPATLASALLLKGALSPKPVPPQDYPGFTPTATPSHFLSLCSDLTRLLLSGATTIPTPAQVTLTASPIMALSPSLTSLIHPYVHGGVCWEDWEPLQVSSGS